ncbi:MAG: molybdopterin molybdotransferase MoeA [Rhizobiales bacterium]|nr:molybdopterin molybdotransferase MoeA [Hyphomicrobiales bacterium]
MALLPVSEAVSRIVSGICPRPAETVPLNLSPGRRLAEPLAALRSQPPFPASAMDGYAVRSADAVSGAELKVIGMAAAGHGFRGSPGAGECVRIFTGAPVPEGADAVLIQEDATVLPGDRIRVGEALPAGRNVRAAGLDFRQGDVLLEAGRTMGMREVALAAALGHGTVPVRTRPRVAILATGDELVSPGEIPGPDQIIASNAVGIAAFVAAAGGEAIDLGIAADTRSSLAGVFARTRELSPDVLVTLGGASVGDHDLVQEALKAAGMELDFWKIAMRPGKPLMFGRLGETRVLGLPGNPVSSLVCAVLFLGPLLSALLGEPPRDRTEAAILGADMGENDQRQDYVRATLTESPDSLPIVTPYPRQDSSMLATLARSDCLVIRPPFAPPASAGTLCRILRLP